MTTTNAPRVAPAVGGDWRDRAGCRSVDSELFFPVAESGPLFEVQVVAAKAVCAGCRVRSECLGFALGALPYGVAGGLTPAERSSYGTRTRGARAATAGEGPPVGGSRTEVAAAGRARLAAGCPVREVAREFGVTERTATRWAAQARAQAGEDARGAA